MNSLLARQIAKYLPGVDTTQGPLRAFLESVNSAYTELQQDRDHIEHTLEVTSSELNEANERLRQESESRLQNLDDSYRQTMELQEGMILCFRYDGARFIHTLCRGQLAIRLGWVSEEVEGKGLEFLYQGEDYEKVRAAYMRAWCGESATFEMEMCGVTFIALLRPRTRGTEVIEVIISCVEITEIKEYERSLRQAKERAEKADRAKSEFLAVMSHEIRTPLNAILGFTELLHETQLDQQQTVWLKTVAASGESLRLLIEDILDFSKIEAGMLELHPTVVRLSDLLQSVNAMFATRAAAKNLQFQVVQDSAAQGIFLVDGQRLKQVLINLVGNALKFTAKGSVELRASAAPREADGLLRVRFEVRDSGIGITEEQRPRIFKPFSQADSSTTRVFGGTGLGLAICKRLVALMGGDIDFESIPGRGTCFFFTVAVKPSDESGLTAPPMAAKESAPQAVRVLVVEDRSANRDLLAEVLGRLHCEIDFAEHGRAAVEVATVKDYDLIVMDLQMPEMDGFEATRRIRSLGPRGADPRIVALTASTLAEEHQHCREVGMDAVLTKPLRIDALRREVSIAAGEGRVVHRPLKKS